MAIIGKIIANFCALFLAIDIVGQMVAFLSISAELQPKQIRKNLLNSVYFVFFVSLLIMFLGWIILAFLGVNTLDMQIAAGILLLVFSIWTLLRSDQEVAITKDATLFPAVAQLIITPIFLVMILALMSVNGLIITSISLLINLGIVLYFLINSSKIIGLLGVSGIKIISKIVNMLLCAYAVMLIRQAIAVLPI